MEAARAGAEAAQAQLRAATERAARAEEAMDASQRQAAARVSRAEQKCRQRVQEATAAREAAIAGRDEAGAHRDAANAARDQAVLRAQVAERELEALRQRLHAAEKEMHRLQRRIGRAVERASGAHLPPVIEPTARDVDSAAATGAAAGVAAAAAASAALAPLGTMPTASVSGAANEAAAEHWQRETEALHAALANSESALRASNSEAERLRRSLATQHRASVADSALRHSETHAGPGAMQGSAAGPLSMSMMDEEEPERGHALWDSRDALRSARDGVQHARPAEDSAAHAFERDRAVLQSSLAALAQPGRPLHAVRPRLTGQDGSAAWRAGKWQGDT